MIPFLQRAIDWVRGAGQPPHQEGRLFYDNADFALGFMADIAGNILQIGQEHYIRAINKTGATIPDGRAVYVTGYDATSGRLTIAQAQANAEATALAVGVTTTSFPNGNEGFVTVIGRLGALDTSGMVAGQALYLSATQLGRFTNVRPDRPNMAVAIGFVGAVSATDGTIHVVANRTRNQDVLGANMLVNSAPGRALNSNFQPHASRPTLVIYTVEITATASVAGGNTGTVELRSDANNPPATVRTSATNAFTITLGVGIGFTSTQRWGLVYLVPPGHFVRLNTAGAATIALVNQTEITL